MKKCLVYVALFIIFCFLGDLAVDSAIASQISKRSPYSLSFACIGAISLESRLDCWAKIKSASSSQDLSEYLNQILQALNAPLDYRQVVFNQAAGTLKLQYKISQKNTKYQLELTSSSQEKSTLVSVSIVTSGAPINLLEEEKKLEQVPGLHWQHYRFHRGVLKDPVTYPSQLVLLKVVMKTLQGQDVDIYRDGKLTCVTAYSPILNSRAVMSADRKYNIQAALRSNEREGKTYFYMGSPLIVGEY